MFHSFSAMYAALAIFWTVFIIIALVCYIFYSIGLYTIAKAKKPSLRRAGMGPRGEPLDSWVYRRSV